MADEPRIVPFPPERSRRAEGEQEPGEAFEATFDVASEAAVDVTFDAAFAQDAEQDAEQDTKAHEGMGEAAPRRPGAPTPWATGAEPSANVVPFRRPRKGKLRRRRRSAFVRWLLPFAAALSIVGLPSLFVFWLSSSPSFAMEELVVLPAPSGRVAPEWVRGALRPEAGQNLWLLDLAALEQRLEAHPWLADVGLRKEPPSTLIVRLVERHPAALYRAQEGLAWVDDSGKLIEPVDFSRPQTGLDLPILSGPEDQIGAALGLLGEIETTGAGWAPGLSEIEILGADDFRLHTTALPFPLVVRQGSLASQARHLRALLPRLSASAGTIDAVDLRFSRRIIIKLPPSRDGRNDEQRA